MLKRAQHSFDQTGVKHTVKNEPNAQTDWLCGWLAGWLVGWLAACAGRNYEGQLGDGTRDDRLIPTTVQGSHNYRQVSSGGFHTCGVRIDGAALCWGE